MKGEARSCGWSLWIERGCGFGGARQIVSASAKIARMEMDFVHGWDSFCISRAQALYSAL